MTKLPQSYIEDMLRNGDFTLTDVIDAVIQLNGIIGVGKYTLADDIAEYIRNHKGYKNDTRTIKED